MASDRATAASSVANRVGNIARQVAASVDSPFMTARASSRWTVVASASRPAASATSGSAWMCA